MKGRKKVQAQLIRGRIYKRIEIFKYAIGNVAEILGNEINRRSIECLKSNRTEQQ
ncbi:MAG: hypothetical protein LBF75_02525 [Treponema sp.]|jgi:hypothetical protein|nr:hypothetical protein [Treponema sp.]